MAARKGPEVIAYTVRRPFLYNAVYRNIGDVMKPEDFLDKYKAESLVRAGRLDEVFAKKSTEVKPRTRTKE